MRGQYDVGIVAGSRTDEKKFDFSQITGVLDRIGATWEKSIISAHRNPAELREYCRTVRNGYCRVVIAIAGMAAALPGVMAGYCLHVPIIGVPLPSAEMPDAMDALLSMVRMPPGVPVAVAGIGAAGLKNAAILACQVLAVADQRIDSALLDYLTGEIKNKPAEIGYEASDKLPEQPTSE